jgi:hypothetical protein
MIRWPVSIFENHESYWHKSTCTINPKPAVWSWLLVVKVCTHPTQLSSRSWFQDRWGVCFTVWWWNGCMVEHTFSANRSGLWFCWFVLFCLFLTRLLFPCLAIPLDHEISGPLVDRSILSCNLHFLGRPILLIESFEIHKIIGTDLGFSLIHFPMQDTL